MTARSAMNWEIRIYPVELIRERKIAMNVYESCPIYQNEKYLLRMVKLEDCDDLLEVYSDEAAVPLFNSDNCHGDDFHYTTKEQMLSAIEFWLYSYEKKYFVRWSIVDQLNNKVIGTIELFHRDSNDYYTNCGLLRIDLKSSYEKKLEIVSILNLLIPETYEAFNCSMIATKVNEYAYERKVALESLGFILKENKLIGHDGTEYSGYWVKER